MVAKKNSRKKMRSLLAWSSQVKDAAQVCLAIVTLGGIPVGAYVYLLNAISGTRQDSLSWRQEGRDQFSALEKKVDAGFSQIHADMRVLIERQNNVENQTSELRQEVRDERAERNKDCRETGKIATPRKP